MLNMEKRDWRILYAASQCLFYMMTFKTENYEVLVGNNRTYADKEEVFEYLYSILSEKGDEYYDLISYLAEDVDEAQDNLICGIFSISTLTKGQYAANILVTLELLDRPALDSQPSTDMAETF